MGTDDHRGGYLELQVNGGSIYKIHHNARGFGDVGLSEEELEKGYKIIGDLLYERYIGYNE